MAQTASGAFAKALIMLGLFVSSSAFTAGRQAADIAAMQTRGLPERVQVIPGGRAFLEEFAEASIPKREDAVLDALSRGHFPDFLRTMKPVTVSEQGHTLVFWVMPDYVSVGSNEDHVLIPLSFVSARKLAKSWGFVLPTSKMVDAIFHQAERVIWPKSYKPSAAMASVAWLTAHNEWIEDQRFGEMDFTRLVAGHKKDIVLSSRLETCDKKIAIYGWQNIRNGENIQPLSTWHGDHYVDYSHGLRMVGSLVLLDGTLTPIKKILADPVLSSLLSREGPISVDQIMQNSNEFVRNN